MHIKAPETARVVDARWEKTPSQQGGAREKAELRFISCRHHELFTLVHRQRIDLIGLSGVMSRTPPPRFVN